MDLLLLLFFLPVLLLLKTAVKRRHKSAKLPPGPWKLPVIGSMHHLRGTLPQHAFRNLAKRYGPLMHLQVGEIPILVVSSAAAAREITKTHDQTFANRPQIPSVKYNTYGFRDVAFAPYGPYWRQVRKICVLELLTAKRVESFRAIREEEAMNMLRSVAASAGAPVNLSSMVYSMTNDIVCRAAFGDKSEKQKKFLAAVKESIRISTGYGLADTFPSLVSMISGMKGKLLENHRKFDHLLDCLIDDFKAKKRSDTEDMEENLLQILMRVQRQGDLDFQISINEMKAIIVDMFGAGTDTSGSLVGWTMAELTKNPRVMTKAQAEIREALKGKVKAVTESDVQGLHYLSLLIKEGLRLHPPVPLLLPRENREKCEVMGYEIPAGTRVIINVAAMAREPEYWGADAESFRPERFMGVATDFKGTNFEYLPFGAGRRMCPGVAFGMANVELPLALLLYYFNWELPDGMRPQDLDMTEDFGITCARKSDLYLVPTLCNPLPSE